MAEVWDDKPPRRATAAMHVYVSHLRKFLARPDRSESPIVTRPGGYLLHIGPDEFDLYDFQQLLQRGRTDVRAGRLRDAVEHFDAALRTWRGAAVADLRDSALVQGFVTWLDEMYLECLEARIESQLSLGRHRELVGELYSLTAEYPLHETFHSQLMLALYRSDRQADALRVYRDVRGVLQSELGLEPGRVLRELQGAILAADSRLDLLRAG
jgi:DNA-binding SARP family transcriptional activator